MGLLSYGEEQLPQKYSYPHGLVKGKIAFGNSSNFQAQYEDLRLYSRMVLEIRQSLSTGRTPCFFRGISAPCQIERAE